MLSQMRQANFIKTILWIVVIAFVATMVFVWGADLQGLSCDAQSPKAALGGMVAGQGLDLREYDQRVQVARNQAMSNKRDGQMLTRTSSSGSMTRSSSRWSARGYSPSKPSAWG